MQENFLIGFIKKREGSCGPVESLETVLIFFSVHLELMVSIILVQVKISILTRQHTLICNRRYKNNTRAIGNRTLHDKISSTKLHLRLGGLLFNNRPFTLHLHFGSKMFFVLNKALVRYKYQQSKTIAGCSICF